MTQPGDNVLATDAGFMREALKEAKKGIGRTAPNPCVGAVVVRDGAVVGRGYHKRAGTPHAEIHALREAGDKALGATIYVTLEPCNHTGRTGPCSHAVVAAGISKVVVGMNDPNPLVNGGGNAYLREHGLEVQTGILVEKCIEINRPFIKHINTGIPFVVMKAGVSLDGKLSYQPGSPGQITGKASNRKLHSLRDSLDAILVGSGTVRADNPSLTTRLGGHGRDPLRVILDSTLSLSLDSKILHLDSSASTLIFCSEAVDMQRYESFSEIVGVTVQKVSCDTDNFLDLTEIMRHLGRGGCAQFWWRVEERFIQVF